METMTVVTVIVACAVTFPIGILDAPAMTLTLARFSSLPGTTLMHFLSLPDFVFSRFLSFSRFMFPRFPAFPRFMLTDVAPAFGISFVAARIAVMAARTLVPLRLALLTARVPTVLTLRVMTPAPMPFRIASVPIAALLSMPSIPIATLLRVSA